MQTRHEALTSANPTPEAQTDLQLAKASALEDTQHHRCAADPNHEFNILIFIILPATGAKASARWLWSPWPQLQIFPTSTSTAPRAGSLSFPFTFSHIHQVVWAVSDVATVPPGSVLINPDNGTPYLNSDGSVYLFDPNNPPRLSPHGHR